MAVTRYSKKIFSIILLTTLVSCKPISNDKWKCDNSQSFCELKNDSEQKNQSMLSTDLSNEKLTYYYDALCGWCYGFSPVISKIEEAYADRLTIEVVSGGLFLDDMAGYVNVVAPHIKNGAYRSVEDRTGVKFGKEFLDDVFNEGKLILNSLYPTIALCIVKKEQPEDQIKFAKILLDAVYSDGMNSVDIDGLATLAEGIGFDKMEFISKMESQEYKNAAEKEFLLFKQSSYSGMPAVVLEKNGKEYLISSGYMHYEDFKKNLDLILTSIEHSSSSDI